MDERTIDQLIADSNTKAQQRKDYSLEIATQAAGQIWCTDENKHKIMDVDLALAAAQQIANWVEAAAYHLDNEQYYRGLVVKIGEMLGPDAYTADDGNKHQDVLCAKVPELVQQLINK